MSKCAWPDKVKHASKADAVAAIRSLYRAGRGNPDYTAYPCGNHWHIGHDPRHFTARIRRALRR